MIQTAIARIAALKKFIALWYLLNFAAALVVIAPLAIAMGTQLGSSLESERLVKDFDISWVTEFGWATQWEQVTILLPLLAMVVGTYLLLTAWLSGGMLAILYNPQENFWTGCGRWFWPFVRLAIFGLIPYAIALLARTGCAAMFRKLGEDSMSGKPAVYGAMATLLITGLTFGIANMVLDYSKIHMVAHTERRARIGLWRGVRFAGAHIGSCAKLYFIFTVAMLLMLAVYHVSSEIIGQSSVGAVLLLFLVRQLYVFGRTWLRMVWIASEYTFFATLLPKPATPSTPTPRHVLESLEFNESY